MSAVEVHADALTWVRERMTTFSFLGPTDAALLRDRNPGYHALLLAESVLTRHAPESCLGSVTCEQLGCPIAWPCPDAQAALYFIEAIR